MKELLTGKGLRKKIKIMHIDKSNRSYTKKTKYTKKEKPK